MTLLGSNCWVSLHIMKRGVLLVSCLVPLSPPSLPPSLPFLVSGYCTLFLLIYLVSVIVLGVNAAYWLPWIHCVYLLCAWHHHSLGYLHPTSSIVDVFNSIKDTNMPLLNV